LMPGLAACYPSIPSSSESIAIYSYA